MVARVRTVSFQRIDVLAVDAEVPIAQGLPAFNVMGAVTPAFRRWSGDPVQRCNRGRRSIDALQPVARLRARVGCDRVLR
jgi:hypothetical protein